jgi:hypothetical protein
LLEVAAVIGQQGEIVAEGRCGNEQIEVSDLLACANPSGCSSSRRRLTPLLPFR